MADSSGLANGGYIWTIGKRGYTTHKASPDDPILTLCGVPAEYMAPDDLLAEPELRCSRCQRIERKSDG